MTFEKQIGEDPEVLCAKQKFQISLVNYTSNSVIDVSQSYEANFNPGLAYTICSLSPSFAKIEAALKKAGLQSYLDDSISYFK